MFNSVKIWQWLLYSASPFTSIKTGISLISWVVEKSPPRGAAWRPWIPGNWWIRTSAGAGLVAPPFPGPVPGAPGLRQVGVHGLPKALELAKMWCAGHRRTLLYGHETSLDGFRWGKSGSIPREFEICPTRCSKQRKTMARTELQPSARRC